MKLIQGLISIFILCFVSNINSQNGLVAHWSFDNVSVKDSTFEDESGNTTHGTIYGAGLTHGIKGQALSLDGIDDYARIPEKDKNPPGDLTLLGKGSISVWFKVEHIPTDFGIAPIFYYGAEEQCDFFDAANKGLIIELGHSPIYAGSRSLFFTIWKNGCTYPSFCYDSNDPVSENQWHHFVAVVGENYNTGFLDGKEMTRRRYNFGTSSFSQFFADAQAHEKLWLGKGYWDRTTQYYKGSIDEIKVFNKPLSSAEVKSLYNEMVGNNNDNVTGLNNGNKEPKINIFPNPADGILHYDLSRVDMKLQRIKITGIHGKTFIHKKVKSNQKYVQIHQLPKGTYLIDFIGDNYTFRKKFIISK